MTFFRTVMIPAMSALAMALATAPALAGPYVGYVTAYSDYGNGSARAPVRRAQFGFQVKLPGGPWIYCEHNSLLMRYYDPCSETLRRETVDFWETRSEEQRGRR